GGGVTNFTRVETSARGTRTGSSPSLRASSPRTSTESHRESGPGGLHRARPEGMPRNGGGPLGRHCSCTRGLTMIPPAVPCGVPPKIRELEARLKRVGFERQAAKGSHRKWMHPTGKLVIMSGGEGDDAKKYQESQVEEALIALGQA